MTIERRIETLLCKKASLERSLHDETAHAWQRDSKIVALKTSKLRIMDEVSRLRRCAGASHDGIGCRSDTS